jgi:hypothetical protein
MLKKKETSVRSDGAKVTETSKTRKVKYPNGDLETLNKRTGRETHHVRTNPDGARERDGR